MSISEQCDHRSRFFVKDEDYVSCPECVAKTFSNPRGEGEAGMSYEPTTYCRYCTEPFDVYHAPDERICDSCKETLPKLERAEIGVDGNCGFALLGADLQVGEAEFVEIESPTEASQNPNRYHDSEWCGAADRASRRALAKLRERLGMDLRAGKWLSYFLGPSHPLHVP